MDEFLSLVDQQANFVVECLTLKQTHFFLDLCETLGICGIRADPIKRSGFIGHFRFYKGRLNGWNHSDVGYHTGYRISIFLTFSEDWNQKEDDLNFDSEVNDLL